MTAPETPPSPIGRFEIPLAALLAAACLSAVFLLPLIGAFGVPMAAIPLVRLAHRRDTLAAFVGCALTAAIALGLGWAAGGWTQAIALAVLAGIVTAIPTAGVAFLRAGVDPSRCYLGVCLAGCGLLAAAFTAATGSSIAAEAAGEFDRMTPAIVDSYSRSGADAETVTSVRAALHGAREIARLYLWGIFGALWVLGSAVAFYAGAAGARPRPTADAARFERLRVPAAAAGLFVASGAVFAGLPGEPRRAAGNLLLPLLALFFVAGLSIICHFFRRWFRSRILRAVLYALASYFPINLGVALLGLFDWYVDFRRRGQGVTESS